ncbi:hypothetical protein H9L39_17694 [Fusarium oxysporum f. sp. albedinis]|nr:hypothetical protein H9L39_17694 [Fusarium oxysporum f. sp. albedinis]
MDAVVEGTFVSDPLGQGPPAETLLPTFVDARPRSIVVAALGDVSLPSHLATPNRVPLKSLQHFNRQCFIATNSLSFSPDPFTDPLLQLQTTSRPFLSITATPCKHNAPRRFTVFTPCTRLGVNALFVMDRSAFLLP